MKTIDELRELAEKAKAWRPFAWCDKPRFAGMDDDGECKIQDCGTCDFCIGAQLAAEDVAVYVENAFDAVEEQWRVFKHRHFPRHVIEAERVVAYFGGSEAVSAFAAAVREFCGENK